MTPIQPDRHLSLQVGVSQLPAAVALFDHVLKQKVRSTFLHYGSGFTLTWLLVTNVLTDLRISALAKEGIHVRPLDISEVRQLFEMVHASDFQPGLAPA